MMDKNEFVQQLTDEYCSLPEVIAAGIGGSSATKLGDNTSDIDYYLFVEQTPALEFRNQLVQRLSDRYEVGEHYFGDGDEYWATDIQTELDVMFFNRGWFEDNIRGVWQRYQAANGYTTCFAYTMQKLVTLRDEHGWIKEMKEILATSYPEQLRANIIKQNMMLICDKPFSSYYDQIKVAIGRKDYNSVNHRVAALLASYFDVLFARNSLLHPGEKRLVQFALEHCAVLPTNFAQDINDLCEVPSAEKLAVADRVITSLRAIL